MRAGILTHRTGTALRHCKSGPSAYSAFGAAVRDLHRPAVASRADGVPADAWNQRFCGPRAGSWCDGLPGPQVPDPHRQRGAWGRVVATRRVGGGSLRSWCRLPSLRAGRGGLPGRLDPSRGSVGILDTLMGRAWEGPEHMICNRSRRRGYVPGLDDAVTLHHTCRSRPARVVRARRGAQGARRPLQPWLSVPLMYLGLMFVAIFPVALTVDDAAWALALYGSVLFWALVIAFLAHRWARVTVIESGADLPGTPFPVSARTKRERH